jgi:hypothetical protein
MIQSLLAFKEEVDATLMLMHCPDLVLSDLEWETLAVAKDILKPFDDTKKDLSSQFYPFPVQGYSFSKDSSAQPCSD